MLYSVCCLQIIGAIWTLVACGRRWANERTRSVFISHPVLSCSRVHIQQQWLEWCAGHRTPLLAKRLEAIASVPRSVFACRWQCIGRRENDACKRQAACTASVMHTRQLVQIQTHPNTHTQTWVMHGYRNAKASKIESYLAPFTTCSWQK